MVEAIVLRLRIGHQRAGARLPRALEQLEKVRQAHAALRRQAKALLAARLGCHRIGTPIGGQRHGDECVPGRAAQALVVLPARQRWPVVDGTLDQDGLIARHKVAAKSQRRERCELDNGDSDAFQLCGQAGGGGGTGDTSAAPRSPRACVPARFLV